MKKIRILDPGWKKFGSWILDGKNLDRGSWMEKIRIRDPGSTSRIRNTAGTYRMHLFLTRGMLRLPGPRGAGGERNPLQLYGRRRHVD
jgi:hypothetical protein